MGAVFVSFCQMLFNNFIPLSLSGDWMMGIALCSLLWCSLLYGTMLLVSPSTDAKLKKVTCA